MTEKQAKWALDPEVVERAAKALRPGDWKHDPTRSPGMTAFDRDNTRDHARIILEASGLPAQFAEWKERAEAAEGFLRATSPQEEHFAAIEAEREAALARAERARRDLATVDEDRLHWIRLFNRLEAAVTHHRKAEGEFATEADEALWKARAKVLADACKPANDAERVLSTAEAKP